METKCQELRRAKEWHPYGAFDIKFETPQHLVDSLKFLSDTGQTAAFWEKIGYLTSLFVRDAAGRAGGNYDSSRPNVRTDEDHPPRHIALILSLDSVARPSFIWRAYDVETKTIMLSGGLIYRDADGWTVHT